ncbi:MAG TPA: taurine dioxygenase [Rhodospirillaceae bacterium]|nr:taurine dioxygenase [Rhodospirillaceae bacterium]HAT35752.1 taurine dioxygenase [Rhodospirillaceae bacterium]
MSTIEIVPTDAPIGAEIRGVDLSRPLSDETFAEIEQAFDKYSVAFLRDQELNEEQYQDFVCRFGEMQVNFLKKYTIEGRPLILQVSNIQVDGEDIGHADAGRVWHSDMSYEWNPPRISVLHAREVPVNEDGEILGDTLFASAVLAYESLSEEMKQRCRGLKVKHDVAGRRKKTGTGGHDDAQREAMEKVVHPAVRIHPYTGKTAIFVNLGECVSIEGMDDEEALDLINELAATVIRPEFQYRHKWRVGDVLMWDNCALQHLAMHDYQLPQRRMMWRISGCPTEVYE